MRLITAVAMRLLHEYAPPRPVRLLGVRVAGLASADAPAGDPTASSHAESARSGGESASAARGSLNQLALPVSGSAHELASPG